MLLQDIYRKRWYFFISLCILLFDQTTKLVIVRNLHIQEAIKATSFLDIKYVTNTGSFAGMLQELGNPIFIILSIVAIALILAIMVKVQRDLLALSLFLGGAMGNLVDRLTRGYVVDFIYVHAGKYDVHAGKYEYYWPIFNVADSALSIGIALFILGQLIWKERR